MKAFPAVVRDGVVKVEIDDYGFAILRVQEIKDVEPIVEAIIRAYREVPKRNVDLRRHRQ